MPLSGFYAAYVRTVAGIYLDHLTLVDKERHTHGSAGLHCSGLESIGGCVALEAGLGIGYLQSCLCGHFGIEHSFGAGIAHNLHYVSLLHVVGTCHEILADGNLVESLLIHEVVVGALSVEELIGAALHAHILKLFTDVEAALEHTAVHHILELCAHESISLTGLHVKEFDHEIETAVHADAGAVLDVLSVHHCCIEYYMLILCEISAKDADLDISPQNYKKLRKRQILRE